MAYTAIFDPRTRCAVKAWLARLGVPSTDRDDARQDVLLAAHQSFQSYDPRRARPERWLNKITVRVASKYHEVRRNRRTKLTTALQVALEDERPTAEEQLVREQTRKELLSLLHQHVDTDLRVVLTAHDLDDTPMIEIAAWLGIPTSTVYKRHARARRQLREAWSREQHRHEDRQSTPTRRTKAHRSRPQRRDA
ncbi:ECF family RNA polymerase sigma factor [Chondromyces crocatus]|uniref:ECF family RNA polymerase sigma factor n=2 Tax=Chondromyces crocatus TaxID=52 RepID=A0A0K1EDY1_CHOCO|nr:ECF family RNA polymerase sigma factor [Chondromyces crocatus]